MSPLSASVSSTSHQSSYITVGAGRTSKPFRLHYQLHGNGPSKLLLIMGLHMSLHSWGSKNDSNPSNPNSPTWLPLPDHQLEYFGKQKSSQYTVLVLDNRGVGNSDSPIGIYSSSEMAKDTLELLDHLEWTSNVNCVGSSMGGMIAQELALLSPHRFISLALISTHAGRTIPPFTALYKFPIYAFVPDSLQRLEILAGMLFSETKRNAPAPQGFVPQHLPVPKIKKGNEGCNADGNKTAFTMAHKLLDIMISRTKRTRPQPFLGAFGQFFAPMTHAVSPSRLRILKEQHHLEIMVVQRTWDNIFRTSNSPYIARHTGGKLVIVQGAGHEINTEEPELFNSLIEEFIHKRTNRGTKTEL